MKHAVRDLMNKKKVLKALEKNFEYKIEDLIEKQLKLIEKGLKLTKK